jgi:ectoine hydroxylase-related dioxygenase (phytanoyl-CoA dioxygenase family)
MAVQLTAEPKSHPLNRGFAWAPLRGPFRCISEEQARSYDELGFFVLRGALDPATVAEAIAEIDPLEAQAEAWLRTQPGGRVSIARAGEITFTTHLVTRSERLRALVSGPPFLDLVHDILGPDVRMYWDQAVYKKPGTPDPFPWHQDNGYAFIEPQQYLTCWIALTDTDEESSCPWIAPGLHRRGTLEHRWTPIGHVCLDEAPPDAIAAPVRAGDAVIFSSLTPHATGPHRGTHVRKAYIIQYAPDGAEILRPDGQGDLTRTPATDPARQFPVLIGGRPAQRIG